MYRSYPGRFFWALLCLACLLPTAVTAPVKAEPAPLEEFTITAGWQAARIGVINFPSQIMFELGGSGNDNYPSQTKPVYGEDGYRQNWDVGFDLAKVYPAGRRTYLAAGIGLYRRELGYLVQDPLTGQLQERGTISRWEANWSAGVIYTWSRVHFGLSYHTLHGWMVRFGAGDLLTIRK